MKTAIAIIGRMSSSRLPGKSLISLPRLSPLEILCTSGTRSWSKKDLFILTSNLACDDPIANFAKENTFNVHRGHPSYVLDRLVSLANTLEDYDYIIPAGTDCPLADWELYKHIADSIDKKNFTIKPKLFTSYFPSTFPSGIEPIFLSCEWLKS